MSRGRRSRSILAAAAVLVLVAASGASGQLLPEPTSERARVAYVANGDLFTIAADGSGRTRIAEEGLEPAWSPDRSAIAFTRYVPMEDFDRAQIWAAAPDGSGARRVSSGRSSGFDSAPAWSPDGRRIAFVRLRFSFRDETAITTIVTAAAGGGDERAVARLVSKRFRGYTHLAWSPDGTRLLATESFLVPEDASQLRPALYAVGLADGRRTRLLRNGGDAAWSPDGARIAYAAARPGCEADQCSEIYVANADGGGRRRLTTDEADDAEPSWSADGSRIAFASTRNYPYGEQPEIYTIQPDGGCLTWLTNGTAQSFDPAWEPGAELSTDPGGCGAVPREPLIETDTSEIASYRRTPVWWLGMRFGNLLLTGADGEDGTALLDYGDCAVFDPAQCEPGFDLENLPVCESEVLEFANPRGLARHEGALVAQPQYAEEDHPKIFVGTTYIGFDSLGSERVPQGVLENLRRFGEDAPPAGGLPRAELPLRMWHGLERMRARVRKYGSVTAVARRFRISRRKVQDRLALDRSLRKLGPFGRLDCAKR